jgi:hypothetical protein
MKIHFCKLGRERETSLCLPGQPSKPALTTNQHNKGKHDAWEI